MLRTMLPIARWVLQSDDAACLTDTFYKRVIFQPM